MELKSNNKMYSDNTLRSFNRTFMELKFVFARKYYDFDEF